MNKQRAENGTIIYSGLVGEDGSHLDPLPRRRTPPKADEKGIESAELWIYESVGMRAPHRPK